jgi:3-phenylpropionate/trans-cinnamate dioxygenase ferredoxin subunit
LVPRAEDPFIDTVTLCTATELCGRGEAGKRTGATMADFVKVARVDEIGPGQARLIEVKGKQIALFNINGDFFAIDNMCTHEEASLAEGQIMGHEVTCPLHGAKFDVRTGEVLGPPAYDDVACYSVRVVGSDVELQVE